MDPEAQVMTLGPRRCALLVVLAFGGGLLVWAVASRGGAPPKVAPVSGSPADPGEAVQGLPGSDAGHGAAPSTAPVGPAREELTDPDSTPLKDHPHLLPGDIQVLDADGQPVSCWVMLADTKGGSVWKGLVPRSAPDGVVDTMLTPEEFQRIRWWWIQPAGFPVPQTGAFTGPVIRMPKTEMVQVVVQGAAIPWPVTLEATHLPRAGMPKQLDGVAATRFSVVVQPGSIYPVFPVARGDSIGFRLAPGHRFATEGGMAETIIRVADGEVQRVTVSPEPGRWFRLEPTVARPSAGPGRLRARRVQPVGERWWRVEIAVTDAAGQRHLDTFEVEPEELLWIPARLVGGGWSKEVGVAGEWRLMPIAPPASNQDPLPLIHRFGSSKATRRALQDERIRRREAVFRNAVRKLQASPGEGR